MDNESISKPNKEIQALSLEEHKKLLEALNKQEHK